MPIKSESNIPLHCSLCPKKPHFSDLSHLLTHIASKSHLSYRFKLQIRAGTEDFAKDQLNQFDEWYARNSIDKLLSDRLAAKEGKKQHAKSRARSAVTKEEMVDKTLTSTPQFKAPIPRMHIWATASAGSSASLSEWVPSPVKYETPSIRRPIPNFTREDTEDASEPADTKLVTPHKPSVTNAKKPKIDITEGLKLKGVHWPGMDIFDSATPEMKRVRNQRKDSSVLESMIATSEEITATEWVFTADGEFRNSRDIFGPLSCDNSPAGPPGRIGEHNVDPTSPKKRKTRSSRRPALSDVSVNAPRRRPPRTRKAVAQSPAKRNPPPRTYNTAPIRNPLASFGANFRGKYRQDLEHDEGLRLTAGDGGKKRTFGVFHDAPEISPGRTESPLEEARFDFQVPNLPAYPSRNPQHYVSPTPMAKPSSSRALGKENEDPELMAGQVHFRRTISASPAFPPQLFFNDPSFNPLYSPYLNNALQTNGFHNSGFGRASPARQSNYVEDFKSATNYQSTFHGNFREVEHPYRSPPIGPSTHSGNGFGNFNGAENPYHISSAGPSTYNGSEFGNFKGAENPYSPTIRPGTHNSSGFNNFSDVEIPHRSPTAVPSTHNSSGFGNAAATSPATGMYMGA